ncbi:MAG: SRPBCC family protein [Salinibacter sp.]
MLTVRHHVDVPAPVDAVFSFMDEPARQADITPNLSQSELIERLPNGGSRARYVYTILGLPFSGEVVATDYEPDERIIWALRGDLRGTIRWYFSPHDGGTRLTYAATYAVPGPAVLRPLLTPLVRRYNDREVRRLLKALRYGFAV